MDKSYFAQCVVCACVCVSCVCACACVCVHTRVCKYLSQMPPNNSVEPTPGLGLIWALHFTQGLLGSAVLLPLRAVKSPLTSGRLVFCTTGCLHEEDSGVGCIHVCVCRTHMPGPLPAGLGPPGVWLAAHSYSKTMKWGF